MEKYAGTFVWFLKRMIEDNRTIRVKRSAGVDYPGELEWVSPDKIGIECWRKTCRLNKLDGCEEMIERTIADGGFVDRCEIEGRSKWLVQRMIHHGLIDNEYRVTDLGREVYQKQWVERMKK